MANDNEPDVQTKSLGELRMLAIREEERVLPIKLTEEDRQALADQIAEITVHQHVSDEEFANVKREYTEQKKDRTKDLKKYVQTLRRGYEERQTHCFIIPNHADHMMETYDHRGVLVERRRMRPEERQLHIVQLNHEA